MNGFTIFLERNMDKLIGKKVYAGGPMKRVYGTIIDKEIDSECGWEFYLLREIDGHLSKWAKSEITEIPNIRDFWNSTKVKNWLAKHIITSYNDDGLTIDFNTYKEMIEDLEKEMEK